MINRYQAGLYVLPEDDANRQIANGFVSNLDLDVIRRFQVLPELGGWQQVVTAFTEEYVPLMRTFPATFTLLAIDFDGDQNSFHYVREKIPNDLIERVFVIGTLSEPENLKPVLGSLESVGAAIANDCRNQTNLVWQHNLLHHNIPEVLRLTTRVHSFLFPS